MFEKLKVDLVKTGTIAKNNGLFAMMATEQFIHPFSR